MRFITPEEIAHAIDVDKIALDINMLTTGKIKLQTIHNHTAKALKDCELDIYMTKVIAKAFTKFLTKHEGL